MKRHHSLKPVRLLFVGVSVLFGSGSVDAVEWSAEPYVSLRALYTDNFTLTTDPHPDVFGAQAGPGLRLNAEAENWKISTEANLRFNRYNESQFNTTEGDVGLRSEYRAERNTYGLNAHFIRDNTLVGELATTGIAQSFSPRARRCWQRSLCASVRFNENFTSVLNTLAACAVCLIAVRFF